jgi:hypothetical protein
VRHSGCHIWHGEDSSLFSPPPRGYATWFVGKCSKSWRFYFTTYQIPHGKCWWLGQILYVCTCTIARLSIAATLLRLTIDRTHSCILYGVVTFSTAIGIVFLFFTIFQCHPVAYYWNHYPETGHCLNINILLGIVYMYSGVAATCDIMLGSLPILLIWRLQMDRRTKSAVSGILGIAGMFVCSAFAQNKSWPNMHFFQSERCRHRAHPIPPSCQGFGFSL